MTTIHPFRCDIPDSAIVELRQRLAQTRWPDQLDEVGWSFGVEKNICRSSSATGKCNSTGVAPKKN